MKIWYLDHISVLEEQRPGFYTGLQELCMVRWNTQKSSWPAKGGTPECNRMKKNNCKPPENSELQEEKREVW